MKKNLNKLGFIASNETESEWSFQAIDLGKNKNEDKNILLSQDYEHIDDLPLPWKVDNLSFFWEKDDYFYKKIIVNLDTNILMARLKTILKRQFKNISNIDFSTAAQGGWWCLCEFDIGSKLDTCVDIEAYVLQPKHSAAGFRFVFDDSKDGVSLFVLDHFYLGDVPREFLCVIIASLVFALGLDIEGGSFVSFFEYKFDFTHLIDKILLYMYPSEVKNPVRKQLLLAGQKLHLNVELSQNNVVLSQELNDFSSKKFAFSDYDKNIRTLPIEVLETRELIYSFQDKEHALISGNTLEFEASVDLESSNLQTSLYALRRVVLPGFSVEKNVNLLEKVSKQLSVEPNNLIFLSFLANYYIKTKSTSEALTAISNLGEKLFSAVDNFSDLNTCSYVLPRLLGDMWLRENPSKAEECYKEILSARGERLDILLCLIYCTELMKNDLSETHYLERLLKLTLLPELESTLHYRLLQIKSADSSKVKEAISHGLRCIDLSENIDALLKTVDLFCSISNYSVAIELLTQFYNEKSKKLSAKYLSTIKFKTAEIWFKYLHRHDLAKPHAETAFALDAENISSLSLLEEIVRKENNPHTLINILNIKLETLKRIESSSTRDIYEICSELVSIYSNNLKDTALAFNVYLDYVNNFCNQSSEVEEVLRSDLENIDWRILYNGIVSKSLKINSSKSLFEQTFSLLLDLLLEKLVKHVHWHELTQLIGRIFIFSLSKDDSIKFIDTVLNYLNNSDDVNRYPIIDSLYKKKFQITTITSDDFDGVVRVFRSCAESNMYLKHYICLLLDKNILLGLESSLVREILEGDNKYLDIYYKLSLDGSGFIEDVEHLRAAVNFYELTQNIEFKNKALIVLCTHTKVEPEDLFAAREALFKTKKLNDWATILNKQAELVDDKNIAVECLNELADLYENELRNVEGAIEAYEKILDYKDEIPLRIKLIDMLKRTNNKAKEAEELKHIIANPHFIHYLDLLEPYIDRYISEYGGRDFVAESFMPVISYFVISEKHDLSIKLCTILRKHGILTKENMLSIIRGNVANTNFSSLYVDVIQTFELLTSKEEVEEVFVECKELFEKHDVIFKWIEFLVEFVESSEKLKLPDEVFRELMIKTSEFLGAVDKERKTAYMALNNLYQSNNDDERVWIPLYLLKCEFESPQEVSQYIEAILPKIRENPDSLKNYPITISSLELALNPIYGVSAAVETPKSTAASLSIYQDINWRVIIKERDVVNNVALLIKNKAFDNEVEKHVALQCSALLTGDLSSIADWHWQVWREHDTYTYPMDAVSRFPDGGAPDILSSNLGKLLLKLSPVLVKLNRNKFRIEEFCKTIGSNAVNGFASKILMPWDHQILQNVGIPKFLNKLGKIQKYRLYSVDNLGERIFFDGKMKSFYVDLNYYSSYPTSIFLHRFVGVLWAIRLRYYIPMMLDPVSEILPLLNYLRDQANQKPLDKIKRFLGLVKSPYDFTFNILDRNDLESLCSKVGNITPREVITMQEAMREHIYRLQLTETLDVVGVFESIIGHDLLAKQSLKPNEILGYSPKLSGLLDFMTTVKL